MKIFNKALAVQAFFFFIFFWLIFFGLGYPTLNRYDPRTIEGLSDSVHYLNIVRFGPQEDIGHWRYRVLIPYLAKPIKHLVQGKIRTWDDAAFGLLFINSFFVASTALITLILGLKLGSDYNVTLTASLIFLLNFTIANYHLSGNVDSGENCLLLLVALALVTNHWKFLPILGIVGGLAKETFIPFSLTLATVYALWQPANWRERTSHLIQAFLLGIVSLLTVLTVQSLINGQLILPWNIIASEHRTNNLTISTFNCILGISGKEFWYVFGWLLPLGAIRLRNFPRPLVYGSMAAAGVALILGGWNACGGNVGRAVFNAIGPLLSLSVADLLNSLGNSWQLLQVNRR